MVHQSYLILSVIVIFLCNFLNGEVTGLLRHAGRERSIKSEEDTTIRSSFKSQFQRKLLASIPSESFPLGIEDNTDWTMRAALFTPFGLTPGNGERYFFTMAKSLVMMGYDVDIILFEDNPCFTAFCVEETLKSLRINLKFEDFRIRLIPEDAVEYSKDGDIYDIFIGMGIKKVIYLICRRPSTYINYQKVISMRI